MMRNGGRMGGLAAALLLNGCIVIHRNPLPPGHIDVHAPPRDLSQAGVQSPDDAGEDVTWLNFGVLGGLGVNHRDGHSAQTVGPEVSLHIGESPADHQSDDHGVRPHRAWGVNLGWALDPKVGRGPLYLELQRTVSGLWGALGWAWNPASGTVGPQWSVGLGPLFVRANYLSNHEGTVMMGLAIKGGVSWVKGK